MCCRTLSPGRLREGSCARRISPRWCALDVQEDLKYLEMSEDANEEFYGGGGSIRPLEHFPQLWCRNGTYSAYGQVQSALSAMHVASAC